MGLETKTNKAFSKEGTHPLDHVLLSTHPSKEQKHLTNKKA